MNLYIEKKDCCGCGACSNACPKAAISMQDDEWGFLYPLIDKDKCIDCGKCLKVCPLKNQCPNKQEKECYAASSKNEQYLRASSSGAIFPEIAHYFYQNMGVVYGAAYKRDSSHKLYVTHIRTEDEKELATIQNSKYVQSQMRSVFKDVKNDLMNNRKVLFSGTPCQVAALYSYLGHKHDNLYTIETICHGTPSRKLFQDYLDLMEKKLNGTIETISFRDKKRGWGKTPKIVYRDRDGHKKERVMQFYGSSYFLLFLRGDILRESCYDCIFANEDRVADITLGDFWGIEREHPSYLTNGGGKIDRNKGVSCIIVNSEKGKKLVGDISDRIYIFDSAFSKITPHNLQLIQKFPISINRDKLQKIYKEQGFDALENAAFDIYRKKAIISYYRTSITTSIRQTPLIRKVYQFVVRIKKSIR